MRRGGSVCLCVLLLACVLLIMPASASYPMFHYDVERTGNFTDGGPPTAEILWKTEITGLVGASPIIWNGNVYVTNWFGWGEWNPGLYCVNASNGNIVWRNENITGASSVAIYNRVLFIGSQSGNFSCVNATTGNIIWSEKIENNPGWYGIASSPLIYNEKVYITTFSSGALHCFDISGTELWNITTGNEISCFTSPAAYEGLIFFAGNSTGNALYCVNENGIREWTFSIGEKITNTPSIDNGNVYFATSSKLYAVNITSHTEVWNVSFSGTMSIAALSYGKVFIGSKDGNLYCFNATTGNLLWEFETYEAPLGGKIDSSPAVANGIVYFGTNWGGTTTNGTIYAVNVSNGELVWAYSPPNYIMSSPFIYGGKLYIGADDGYLYCFGHISTIWEGGASLLPGNITITLKDGNTTEINGLSTLSALVKASEFGGFNVTIANTTYGLYVESVADIPAEGLCGWMYLVNYPHEGSPTIGADKYILSDGDVVHWYYGCYDPQTWEPSTPAESEHVIKIGVQVPDKIYISELNVTDGGRGGNATAWVNVTALADGWYVIVVSGVNENGEAIAGISTLRLAASDSVRLPAIIPIPQQVQTGNYKLYAGVYRLDDYPNTILHWYGYDTCKVS